MAKKLTDGEKAKAASLRDQLLTRRNKLEEAKRSNPSAVPAWESAVRAIKQALEALTGKKEE